MDIFLNDFSQLAPKNNVMPISMVRHLRAVLQRIATFRSSQTHTSHRYTLFHIADFRLLPYIANQHHFVHTRSFICKVPDK